MYISQVIIRNFWKKGNIEWNFENDVNVLVGNNGSGKSTIINLIYESLQTEISEEAKKKYFSLISDLIIRFSDHSVVLVDSLGERFPNNLDKPKFHIDKISTFDISNSLDELISNLRLEYEIYKNNKNKQLELGIQTPGVNLEKLVSETIARRKTFLDILNNLLKETNKTFSEDTFTFKINNQEYELLHSQLSSGEKQIFYILLKALIQDNKPTIFLLDEPEISLHIEWQRELLNNIRILNPNCQIITVTHSSNIFFRGWLDNKFNMTDIQVEKLKGQIDNVNGNDILLFKKELERIESKKSLKPINEINSILHRNFFQISYDDAKSIIKMLNDKKIVADEITYTTLISKMSNQENAKKLLKDMELKKLQPNGITYTILMKKTDNFEDAMQIFNVMREKRIEPMLQHFSVLLGKADKTEDVQRVEELRSWYGITPNDIYSNKLRVKK